MCGRQAPVIQVVKGSLKPISDAKRENATKESPPSSLGPHCGIGNQRTFETNGSRKKKEPHHFMFSNNTRENHTIQKRDKPGEYISTSGNMLFKHFA